MNLAQYFQHGLVRKADFSRSLGISPSLLHQWVNGIRPVSIQYCRAIEEKTNGEVTRQDLRPDDWQKIWPELATTAPTPPTLPHTNPNGGKRRETQIPVQRGLPKDPTREE